MSGKSGRRWCALVPMRHESERVPGKNYRALAGRPLFFYVLDALHEVEEIDLVVVDTDSPTIKDLCAESYSGVVVLDRPAEIAGGEVPMTTVLAHDVAQLQHDWFVQTHSTNPFLTPTTISRAIRTISRTEDADSLFTVSRFQGRLYDSNGGAINHDPAVLLRTQDLTPVFLENSNLYLFSRELALQGDRIGKRPIMLEMSAREAHDIDTEDDWDLAVLLAKLAWAQ